MYSLDEVRAVDEEIAQAIVEEQKRQDSHIELIASENFVSENIRQVSPKTGKPIKVNTFKWKVAELRELVSNYLDACYNMCEE